MRSRLKLATELLRSVTPGGGQSDVLDIAVQRDAELESGKVVPLTETEFWAGVKRSGDPRK